VKTHLTALSLIDESEACDAKEQDLQALKDNPIHIARLKLLFIEANLVEYD
jgi:hypothetical protein